jgi:hypothetical protein
VNIFSPRSPVCRCLASAAISAMMTGRRASKEREAMEFGILFTSHPNSETETYPHRDVHARVTR